MKRKLRLLSALVLAAITIMAWLTLPDNPPISQPEPHIPAVASAASVEVETFQKPEIIQPKIILYGTFVNDQTQLALISNDNEAQRWLSPKQYLNSDFYLESIFKDHVFVRDAGNTMTLQIYITNSDGTQELSELPVPATPAHAWVEVLPPVPGIDRTEPNHYRVKRDLVMKELQSGEIFKQVKLTQEDNGGFSINRIKQGSMAEVIGLRVGDTIHKINGKPLTNITDVLDLYKNLDSLEKVDVEINRMHQVQQLHYELN